MFNYGGYYATKVSGPCCADVSLGRFEVLVDRDVERRVV